MHAGCTHCYAETLMDTRYGKVEWGPNGTRMLTTPANWSKPLKWNRDAEKSGVRHRVFCASLCDVFEDWTGPMVNAKGEQLMDVGDHNWRPASEINARAFPGFDANDPEFHVTMKDARERLFYLIDRTPWLDWQLLTKRPENVLRMWRDTFSAGLLEGADVSTPLMRNNVWIGTSVSDQETAGKQIPELLKCLALSPCLFLSCEPLLGPIEFSDVSRRSDAVKQLGKKALDGIDWVIVGGESGPGARPCNVEWCDSLVNQCGEANVPVFMKQLGSNPKRWNGTARFCLTDSKGGNMEEWPGPIRVRQFPEVVVF